MIRFARAILLIAAFGLLSAASLRADTLLSNLGQSFGGITGVGLATSRIATDFLTDGSDATITGATLRLINQDNVAHTVTVSLWSDSGSGSPGTLLGSFVPISIPGNGGGLINQSFSSAGIGLEANSAYWVVMQINEDANANAVSWQYTVSGAADAGSVYSLIPATRTQFSGDSGDTWLDDLPANFQFSLLPEPDGFAQLGAGVLALLLLRRHKP